MVQVHTFLGIDLDMEYNASCHCSSGLLGSLSIVLTPYHKGRKGSALRKSPLLLQSSGCGILQGGGSKL